MCFEFGWEPHIDICDRSHNPQRYRWLRSGVEPIPQPPSCMVCMLVYARNEDTYLQQMNAKASDSPSECLETLPAVRSQSIANTQQPKLVEALYFLGLQLLAS